MQASFKSRSSDRTDDLEAPAPPTGPGAAKRMSAAEQELQMTEEVVNPEGQTTLAQVTATEAFLQQKQRDRNLARYEKSDVIGTCFGQKLAGWVFAGMPL